MSNNSDSNQNNMIQPPGGLLRNYLTQQQPTLSLPVQRSEHLGQHWIANTVEVMRQWSGKIVVARGGTRTQEPPPPMILYRPDPTPLLPPKPKRWKRSRTMRIALQMRHRRQRWNSMGPTGKRFRNTVLISIMLLLVVIASSGSAYAYAYYQGNLPQLQNLANQQILQTTHIYDRNGVLLKELYDPNGGGRRTYVTFNTIPQVMKDAIVAAEDHTFWTNSGVDPQGIVRAATQYAQTQAVQGGGSTITQQLIKNLTGNAQDTLNRKIPEAILAVGLTQQYSKEKILEMYLNVAPFGSQDLGAESATEEYFHLARTCNKNFDQGRFTCTPGITMLDYNQSTGKHDPYLALARASLLAGMPQSPAEYDPTLGPSHKNLALQRQDYVLNEMLQIGLSEAGIGPITPTVIKKVETITAKMTFTRYQANTKAPHFVQWVVAQLETMLGNGDSNAGAVTLLNGGFNIRTTIDSNLEDYVERAVHRHLDQPELQFFPFHFAQLNVDNNVNNAAVVVMNAKTGEVLAMDGSADYASTLPQIQGQFNSAADAYRQPGSTWKPFVYMTAFEQGWYPGIILPDVKTYFPNGGTINLNDAYAPPDYGGKYLGGNNTIRVATADSRNVPAVKAAMFAGIDNIADTARRFGITALDEDLAQAGKIDHRHYTKVSQFIGPAFALGTMGVPLIQMVGAYQVFANNGMRVPPQSILDMWDNYGNHLYHYDATHAVGVQVVSPQLAYLMTSVLSDEYARAGEFTNDHQLSFWDGPSPGNDPTYPDVAAKTGTTDDFKDNWTIGYTSNVVVGVWAGNANNEQMNNVVGITGAAPIWHSIIERVSGKCGADVPEPYGDGIPCGNINTQFGITTFVPPSGVARQCVSAFDGLAGNGGNCDYMLDGELPQQAGIVSIMPIVTTTTTTSGGGKQR